MAMPVLRRWRKVKRRWEDSPAVVAHAESCGQELSDHSGNETKVSAEKSNMQTDICLLIHESQET